MSTVRDLGYKPYAGKRLSPANNSKVLLRHGLRRAWGSWLVKLAAFLGWLPLVVNLAVVGAGFWVSQQMPDAAGRLTAEDAAEITNRLIYVQLWMFIFLVTLGAGAAALSQDFSQKVFPFYFAKPVTRMQYLAGRVGAVFLWCLALTAVPAVLLLLILVGMVEVDERLATLGLLLPAIGHSLLLSAVCAGASIGTSALSKSRALTMSAWLFLFVVPHVVGVIVDNVGEWPWLRLLALPDLIEVVGDALFGVAREDVLSWMHALPLLIALGAGGLVLAFDRLRRAEVIG